MSRYTSKVLITRCYFSPFGIIIPIHQQILVRLSAVRSLENPLSFVEILYVMRTDR